MNIFLNTKEQRPRAGWRIIFQMILFFIISIIFFGITSLFFGPLPGLFQPFILAGAGGLSVWIAARYIDQQPLAQFGLRQHARWKKELFIGLGIGTVAMSLIFIAEWTTGSIEITGFGWERISDVPYIIWLTGYLVSMVMAGCYEELIFRGYQIQNLTEGFQTSSLSPWQAATGAIAISSAIFGFLHAGNPNANWASTLNIILAGVVLAIPYLVTGNLSISIGIHISWNFLQGGIYGFAVSGQPFRGSLLQIRQEGSNWFTGGAFGPEAGLAGFLGFLAMLIIFYIFRLKCGYTWNIHPSFKKAFPFL